MNIIKKHLPAHCYSPRKMKSVDGLLVHYISAVNITPNDPFNLDEILKIFVSYGYSAHYLIRRNGDVVELVPEGHIAYHAGDSFLNGRNWCNGFMLGVELEGGKDFPYEDAQMLSLGELAATQMTKHGFTLDYVKGHDEVRANWIKEFPEKAKKKKTKKKYDPGKHFQWGILNDMLYSVSAANRRG